MTATTMPREKAQQIVSSLARGRTITATADRTLVDAAIVRKVGERYGYPDLAKREQGLTVPNVGRVPAAIREQYQAAHGGQP